MEPIIVRNRHDRLLSATIGDQELCVRYHLSGVPSCVSVSTVSSLDVTAEIMKFDEQGRLVERIWGRNCENHLMITHTEGGTRIKFWSDKIQADLLFDRTRLVETKYYHYLREDGGPAYYRVAPTLTDLCMFFECHSKGCKRVKSVDAVVEATFHGPEATVGPVRVRPALNYMEGDTPEGMRREYHVSEMVDFNAFALT